jgi:hypothetical protein
MPSSRTVLRWSAYEHEHIERSNDWFWALGIAAVCAAIASLLLGDLFFSLLILLAAATIGLFARTLPEIAEFELSDRGIKANGTMHRFEEIIAFWVEDHDVPRPLLLVDTVKFMSPNLVIPIENIEPHVVRAFLQERVKEVPMREPAAHKILAFFGL